MEYEVQIERKKTMKHKFPLGAKLRDRVTGFVGCLTGIVYYATGRASNACSASR